MDPPAEKSSGKNSEFYDVIEEELLENSSNSEELESEDGLDSSKDSATGVESVISDQNKDSEISSETSNVPKTDKTADSEISMKKEVDSSVVTKKSEKVETSKVEASEEPKTVSGKEKKDSSDNNVGEDSNDGVDESLVDDLDMSDVSSSFAENESVESKTPSPKKKPKKRQPPEMIGYRKRRKVHSKKLEEDDSKSRVEESESFETDVSSESKLNDSEKMEESFPEDKLDESSKVESSSEDNSSESSVVSVRSTRKFSGSFSEVTCTDKYCWICHKEGGKTIKCITCPRVYHHRCLLQTGLPDTSEDSATFHCPECSAILKGDNVNTRSPVLQTVNLDQLSLLLKHVINILKVQKDSHYFLGPVDTKEFPHYRDYIVYPMDLSMLEKNCKNKIYGCTEAFLADVKWILHNSIVFNSKTTKITNVAKNLLKICKREVAEIETCAECYHNLLVRKETWFIEVCKQPHVLVWARLKGFPPWPAKALKSKNGMVDCRFFGAHDKAWVQLKHCFLYSNAPPQPLRVKRLSQFEEGIQECENHIKKLKQKFGLFVYPPARIPYDPNEELKHLRMMLPNYDSKSTGNSRCSINPDRIKSSITPKTLFSEDDKKSGDEEASKDEAMNDTASETTNGDTEGDEPSPEIMNMEVDESSEPLNTPEDEDDDDANSKPSLTTDEVLEPSFTEEVEAEKPVETKTEESVPKPVAAPVKTPDVSETTKPEPSKDVKRKLVSVKKIESINASVEAPPSLVRIAPALTTFAKIAPAPAPAVVAPPRTIINILSTNRSENVLVTSPIVSAVSRPETTLTQIFNGKMDKSKPKSVISVKNFAAIDKCDSLIKDKLGNSLLRKDTAKVTPTANIIEEFDLDKVKDEPVEYELEDTEMISEAPSKPIAAKSLLTKPLDVGVKKRSLPENAEIDAKKAKNDKSVRMVNITDAVTISLVDNQEQSSVSSNKNKNALLKQKLNTPVMSSVPRSVSFDSMPSNKGRMTKPANVTPVSSVQTNKPSPKFIASRPVNGVAMNGTAPRSGVVVQPKQSTIKNSENHNVIGGILDECMSEFHNNFRKVFEETLDKIAGKGDLRAKIILLQKEMENLKRNHELVIDEIKRDYEVQIAELRAASIAQKKFDLASERLKFEQEKERAVKEAKSKQWCSNCQKSANYYCCWNTAYCDFECQKDHWNQHMQVCKNDVKKKTAECSENEPPRIMMQNDVSSNYSLLNGYDKPGTTYTFQNLNGSVPSRNSLSRIQVKSQNNSKTTPRPLLPRVTATVTCTPSSSSPTSLIGNNVAIATSFIDSSFLTNAAMRPNVATSFARQSQFHK